MLMQLLSPLTLVLIFLCSPRVLSQSPAQSPAALPPAQPPAAHTASPKSGPANITKILEKATHFNTFIRLLKSTQMDNMINDKLNDSSHGITMFAPDDNAFGNLRAGILNSYNDNQKVQLLRFHLISSFLSMPSGFQTASNPVSTEAGSSAYYPLNVTTTGNMVNMTTGVVNASVIGTLYSDNQLGVYQVDQVLLPLYFFQSHSPAPAPAPAKAAKESAPSPISSSSSVPTTAGSTSTDTDTTPVQSSSSLLNAIPFAGFLAAALFWFL